MSERERKSMLTAALLLFGAAVVRFVVADGGPAPEPLEGRPSIADSLLAAGDSVAQEKERRSRPLEPGERIDPNTAGEEDLDRLPGVGPATAARIVEDRESGGPFASVDDLQRVRGIGPSTVERMRPFLQVSGSVAGSRAPGAVAEDGGRGAPSGDVPAQRVNVNTASPDELVALPGVGPVTAQRIVESRETEGPFQRPEDLMRVKGIGPKTFARLAPMVTVRQ